MMQHACELCGANRVLANQHFSKPYMLTRLDGMQLGSHGGLQLVERNVTLQQQLLAKNMGLARLLIGYARTCLLHEQLGYLFRCTPLERLIGNVFGFTVRTVRSLMMLRTQVVAITMDLPFADVLPD